MSVPSPSPPRPPPRSDGGPLRIALTAPYSWPEVRRGGERYLHELASALARTGHDVRILTTAQRPSRDVVLGVPVRRVRRRRAPFVGGPVGGQIGFGTTALALLGREPLDVWHALMPADGAAAAATSRARSGLRSVFTSLGIPDRATVDRRPDRHLHRFVVDHIDAYVCISRVAGEHLRTDHGRDPVVVPPGVDLARYAPARRRHARPALLYAGSNELPRKNLPLLLEATSLLRATHPDLELWLVGPGDPTPALAAAPAAARDAVTVAGLVTPEELRIRYARAWATVLPSVDEAFGLVVVESLAAGTPAVVRSDSGGPAEILAGDLDAGALAGPSARDLADACSQALDLAAAGAGTVAACRGVAGRYDWLRSVVPRLEAVYRASSSD